jgi:hypothetical protein
MTGKPNSEIVPANRPMAPLSKACLAAAFTGELTGTIATRRHVVKRAVNASPMQAVFSCIEPSMEQILAPLNNPGEPLGFRGLKRFSQANCVRAK